MPILPLTNNHNTIMYKELSHIKPLVSVVIISYNHESYIEKCLENVLGQKTDFNFEIIVSNDCSKDDTHSIIERIITQNNNVNNIRYYNQEKNLGMIQNTAFVLKSAKGKYIAMCDGDDYWTDPLKLQKQVNFFEKNPNIVFCFHNAERFDEINNKFYPYIGLDKFKDREVVSKRKLFVRGGGTFPTSSAMLRREVVEELPSYFFSFGVNDTPIFFRAMTMGDVGYLSDKMVVYRTTETNWSSQNDFFENKRKNYIKKFNANNEFNVATNYKFADYVKLTQSHLTYQIIFAYFSEEKSFAKRILFLRSYQKHLVFSQKIKAFTRLLLSM